MFKYILLIFILSLSALCNDHLILIGTSLGRTTQEQAIKLGAYNQETNTLDSTKAGEWPLVQTICNSYKSAKASGIKITVLIGANLKCPDGSLVKNTIKCGVHSCSEKQINKALKKTAKRIKKNDNLIIQTASHGESGSGDLYLDNAKGKTLSKKEIAQALNSSGISAKVKKINGIFYQCYSGHHNDLGDYLNTNARFCSISQAKPYITATVSKSASDKKNDSFTYNIWNSYKKDKGLNFISAAAKAEATESWENINRSHIHKWGLSSNNLATKYLRSNNLDTSLVEDSQSIFGINDDTWEDGFNYSKASWRFRNDFSSLDVDTGKYIKGIIAKASQNTVEQLARIKELSKAWKKKYDQRDLLTRGLELFSIEDTEIELNRSEFLKGKTSLDKDFVYVCAEQIKDDVSISALLLDVNNSVKDNILEQKQKELDATVKTKGFKDALNSCLSKREIAPLLSDKVYSSFSQNENVVFDELNELMKKLKKEIRTNGTSYSNALNKKVWLYKMSVSNKKFLRSGVEQAYAKLDKSSSRINMTFKEGINYLKSLLSDNYTKTEANIVNLKNDITYQVMNCDAFMKFVPLLAQMNTLRKIDDIYKLIKDPKVKTKFLDQVLCELGQ